MNSHTFPVVTWLEQHSFFYPLKPEDEKPLFKEPSSGVREFIGYSFSQAPFLHLRTLPVIVHRKPEPYTESGFDLEYYYLHSVTAANLLAAKKVALEDCTLAQEDKYEHKKSDAIKLSFEDVSALNDSSQNALHFACSGKVYPIEQADDDLFIPNEKIQSFIEELYSFEYRSLSHNLNPKKNNQAFHALLKEKGTPIVRTVAGARKELKNIMTVLLAPLQKSENLYKVLSQQDQQGNTPLHYLAAAFIDLELFDELFDLIEKLLPEEKAKLIAIKNKDGQTILDVALIKGEGIQEVFIKLFPETFPAEKSRSESNNKVKFEAKNAIYQLKSTNNKLLPALNYFISRSARFKTKNDVDFKQRFADFLDCLKDPATQNDKKIHGKQIFRAKNYCGLFYGTANYLAAREQMMCAGENERMAFKKLLQLEWAAVSPFLRIEKSTWEEIAAASRTGLETKPGSSLNC